MVGVLVFGRDSDFLDAYDDGTGQLVFALVVGLFAYGIWWMVRLTRFDRPARFLAIGEIEDCAVIAAARRRLRIRRRRVADRVGGVAGTALAVIGAQPPELDRPTVDLGFVSVGRDTTSRRRSRVGRWLVRHAKATTLADEQTASDLELLGRPLEVYAGTRALVGDRRCA